MHRFLALLLGVAAGLLIGACTMQSSSVSAPVEGSREGVPYAEAYVAALIATCDGLCPPEAAVSVAQDADDAMPLIEAEYPGVEFVDASVFTEGELSRPVIRVVRSLLFADPSLVMVRVEFDSIDGEWSATDVLLEYGNSRWTVVNPADHGMTTTSFSTP